MAYGSMAPHERASIEAQVILKGAVELTAAQVSASATDPCVSVSEHPWRRKKTIRCNT